MLNSRLDVYVRLETIPTTHDRITYVCAPHHHVTEESGFCPKCGAALTKKVEPMTIYPTHWDLQKMAEIADDRLMILYQGYNNNVIVMCGNDYEPNFPPNLFHKETMDDVLEVTQIVDGSAVQSAIDDFKAHYRGELERLAKCCQKLTIGFGYLLYHDL